VANNNVVAFDVGTYAAAAQVAPSTFAAASTPIGGSSDNVASQLLDTSNSGINQLLDN
jgi:hypothetical protein